MALALKANGFASHITGVDHNPINAAKALSLGIVDELLDMTNAVANCKLIILAIPVDACVRLLPEILDMVKHQVVLDTGSTKLRLIQTIKKHINRGRYVATHPMWGTEFNGPEAATANAFAGRATVICDSEDSDKDAVSLVKNVYEALGMYPVAMNAHDHDVHVAYVSHIAHITSFALANTVLKKEKQEDAIFELASGGFESTVRLAKSCPAMWLPILKQNRNNVLDVLDEHIEQLMKFKIALEQQDWESLSGLMISANEIRHVLDRRAIRYKLPSDIGNKVQ
jgi:prephenate dehydrogenase